MKKWALRIIAGILLIGLAVSICLAVGYLALAFALRPTSPPALDVQGVRRLNRDAAAYRDPAWSPDGRYLAYARANVMGPPRGVDPYTSVIYIMDTKTRKIRQLTQNHDGASGPSWSPDGAWIAFESYGQIWVVNADGTGARQVSRCPFSCGEPVWSPDGQKLLVSMSPAKGEPAQLYVLDLATGNLKQFISSEFDVLHPAWSPDGTRIAYTETDLSVPSSWSDLSRRLRSIWSYLVIADADGRNVRRLASGIVYDTDPTWAPNGRYLAFVSDRRTRGSSLNMEILILDLETGEISPLLGGKFERDFADPAWSPDGRYIAFVYGNLSTTTDLYIAEVPEAFR